MGKSRFAEKQRFKRSAIRKDLLYFALPAILVYTTGLLVSNRMGKLDRVWATLWNLIRHPRTLFLLPGHVIAGLALIVVGLAIMIGAHLTIGRFHASTLVIRQDHQLITHGIYRLVRHPIYLGAILVCMGVPVYAASLSGLVIMAFLIPIICVRIRIEERLLIEEFGDAYREYMGETRKLIPFIY